MVKTSELRTKDVVNVVDGRRLGLIGDIELDLEQGRVKSVVVPGASRFLGFFGRDRDTVIEWEQIQKIGQDVILVNVAPFTDQTHSS
ncbi:PRC-barrel domain-containing protein [Sulfobacillus acidophilus TPY]|uniref:Sporulation protein, YlmC/YmxH family n=1 Tax=Sulfobacillus acidophilus (strain ATCC 700253 / DSM 10332 / NAL) TaxID=679936 RepID=G8TX42_SULAD|nr:PRC-barrel domain-containing protein [Sulfobacillus acidophilus TPY]AEW04950.1 sporulation protein, YlmC/YmxH family [Sulfobacillus acidophilus DSM 10332]MCY0865218.1 YlmC/YmxH family sporulation protein [Sulfobacillus sp.]